MNQKLRAARTSIRDASRGIRRVENRVDHGEDSSGVKVIYRDCPCGGSGHHHTGAWESAWTGFKRLFYDPTATSTSRTRLTWLSIALLTFLLWFLSESIAWYVHVHFPNRYTTRVVRWLIEMNGV
jgi:hypothetical protein